MNFSIYTLDLVAIVSFKDRSRSPARSYIFGAIKLNLSPNLLRRLRYFSDKILNILSFLFICSQTIRKRAKARLFRLSSIDSVDSLGFFLGIKLFL